MAERTQRDNPELSMKFPGAAVDTTLPHWLCPRCGPVEADVDHADAVSCSKCHRALRPCEFVNRTPKPVPAISPVPDQMPERRPAPSAAISRRARKPASAYFAEMRALVDNAPDFKPRPT